jgi:hypothetical protein
MPREAVDYLGMIESLRTLTPFEDLVIRVSHTPAPERLPCVWLSARDITKPTKRARPLCRFMGDRSAQGDKSWGLIVGVGNALWDAQSDK